MRSFRAHEPSDAATADAASTTSRCKHACFFPFGGSSLLKHMRYNRCPSRRICRPLPPRKRAREALAMNTWEPLAFDADEERVCSDVVVSCWQDDLRHHRWRTQQPCSPRTAHHQLLICSPPSSDRFRTSATSHRRQPSRRNVRNG